MQSTQICLEQLALLSFKPTYSLLFNLAHALSGQVKFSTNLFQSHLLATYAEEHLQNLALALMELTKRTLYLFRERLLGKSGISHWRVIVGEHVKKAVVLTLHEGSVDRNMATLNLEGIGNLLNRHIKRIGKFLGRRTTLVFLFEFREGFADLIQREPTWLRGNLTILDCSARA